MDKLPRLNEDENYIDLGNGEFISEEDFLERFGNDFSYSILITHENTTPRWKQIFNRWKDEGILN